MTFYVPNTGQYLLPEQAFNALISEVGQRVSWMKSHSCPCTYTQTITFNRLNTPGSAQRDCRRCFGLGIYWDTPSIPFRAYLNFSSRTPTPDEPGVFMNETVGPVIASEPSLTIGHSNPKLSLLDPAQPTTAWENASIDDVFVAMDMLSRYTAVLQVGGTQNLPYQQNLQIAPSGAVTVWNPATLDVEQVAQYGVSGPTVVIAGYPDGTNYMVEFQAAPTYVIWKRAGGMPHVRPFGGGTVNEPRRFRLQALDLWTRQRGIQPTAAGSTTVGGKAVAFGIPSISGLNAQ